MDHTPGHRNCPACAQKAYTAKLELAADSPYPEASKLWIESMEFKAGSSGRARFVSGRSLDDFGEYDRSLNRFFRELSLREIHLGHIRQYQEDRTNGLLGPTREELHKLYAKRIAGKFNVEISELEDNQAMLDIVNAEIDAYPQREVNPNKVNQEVSMLIRIMKLSGAWTSVMDEQYQPLQHQESDIPRCLTPEEQELFLRVSREMHEYIYCFSILGIHATLSTIEERSLRRGDINLASGGVVLVRRASAKNKYRIRTIPLTPEASWAAERLLERAELLGSTQPQHFLFPFRVVRNEFDPNRAMTVSGIKYQWNQIRQAAGVPWFTPYGLRHTGCTRYAESGISIHVLLSMAGHMSRRMQQHYIHISEAAKRHAQDKAYGQRSTLQGVKKGAESVRRSTSVLIPEEKLV